MVRKKYFFYLLAVVLISSIPHVYAENPKLEEKISVSFHETKLSHILLLLSKMGDVNIVLPGELNDREMSVDFKDIKLIDAIKNILTLNNLKYIYVENNIRVIDVDLSKGDFEIKKITFLKSEDVTKALNEKFFKGLLSLSPNEAAKPCALSLPEKNSVLVFGNDEQIKAAKEFIRSYDKKPSVDFYKLVHLSVDKAVEILNNLYPYCEVSEYRRYREEKAPAEHILMIKGEIEQIGETLNILRQHDY